MSVSLVLVPTALALATLIGGAGVAGVSSQLRTDASARDRGPGATAEPGESRRVQVQTRMKDPALLGAALGDLGAVGVQVDTDRVAAAVGVEEIELTRDTAGIWTAHVSSADGGEVQHGDAADLIARLDTAYARRVQRAVADRIRERADEAGFDLVAETREEDDSVTMVLNVREYVS